MANTTYTIPNVRDADRKGIYTTLASLIEHLVSFPGVDLVSIVKTPGGTITIVLSGPVPDNQENHLGLLNRKGP